MYTVENCPRFFCCHCNKYRINADREECICPKLDHKNVKFYTPYFKSYDCGMHHLICNQFVPSNPNHVDFEEWTNFEDYWKVYEKAWLTDSSKNKGIAFIIPNEKNKMFYVPLETWLYGDVVKNGILQANIVSYHVRKIINNVAHYPLVYEAINGISLRNDV